MAILTTNISSVSLTVRGNTTQSTNISWTCPSVPAGCTINSCTLTGTATASMSKGNATIKVNGTTVSSGSNFTINLGTGNTTTSVAATAVGGNKNASGTVTFSNLVYTVNYSEPVVTYTVTFKDWDGSVLKTQTVNSGSSATAPSNPSREGYTFTGWDKTFTNISSDLTVTAQYIIKTYTVRFYEDEIYVGSSVTGVIKTEIVEHGKSATAPEPPVKEGYTFIGWSAQFTNVTSDSDIYADYAINKYMVTFVDYDGTVLKTEEVLAGSSATAPEVSRENYIFLGWSVDFSNVTSNITTIARYKPLISLNIKENGNWSYISKIYKKINGYWIEQPNTNLNVIFDINTKYYNAKPNPIAILYSDGTFIFQDSNVIDPSHGDVINTYTGWDIDQYGFTTTPWNDNTDNIINVIINTIVSPQYIRFWFSGCSNLASINLSNFDTSNVINMESIFSSCFNLTSIDVSNLDTSNVTDMSSMFSHCSNLTSLDLSNFDISRATVTSMFINCTKLQTVYVKDETAKTKIESSSGFPSTATVIIGSPNN